MAQKSTPTSFGFGFTFTSVLLAMFWARAMAQSSCTNTIISMSPCLNYITGNSPSPSQQCCTQLASVVRSSPECLCQVLNGGGSSLGININQTQALALPGACNVQTPPISRCNAGSPAESPAGTPNFQTPGAPSGTSDGSKSTDTDGTSDGNSVKLSMSLLIFVLLTAYSSALSAF